MITVALTGASGAQVGLRLIEELRKTQAVKTVISDAGKKVLALETNKEFTADYSQGQIDADIASSSNPVDMIICPCSMKTLAAIAHGYSDNLITRAADNCLKMRRKLIMCVRETPYNLIHIENMKKVTEAGAIVMPLNIAYYTKPRKIDDITNFFVGKILDLLGIEHSLYPRWKNELSEFLTEFR